MRFIWCVDESSLRTLGRGIISRNSMIAIAIALSPTQPDLIISSVGLSVVLSPYRPIALSLSLSISLSVVRSVRLTELLIN
jgi:hypothetical protein